jgi:rhomboid protease GluP
MVTTTASGDKPNTMATTPIEIFRSPHRGDCEDRAFVLSAVGISSIISFDGSHFILQVDTADATAALGHLEHYDAESRPAPPPPQPISGHPYAWVGCIIYGLVLTGVAFLNSNGLWRLDAFDVGELDAQRVRGGQWWRVWTALTLHVDGAHFGANLLAGAWFGYLAARQIGSGNAWLLIVIAAGIANALEALLGPSPHRAVGASTAIFAALGLMAAHSWRARWAIPQRWALRWGPLIAGVVLLGWLGTAGEGTDLLAHLAGFVVGALFGAVVPLQSVSRTLNRVPQWLGGLFALALIVIAWALALARS